MAERATPKAGHNLAPDTFLEHYRAYAAAQRELSEAQSANNAVLKKAKAAGINIDMMKAVFRARKEEPETVEQDQRDFLRYARWVEMPIGTQASLFGDDAPKPDDKAAAEQREWAAEEAGYESGKNGGNRGDCPFPAGTPLHQRWDAGWLRGQAKIAGEMGDAGAEKPKRGRRGKRRNAEDGPGDEA